MLNSMPRILKLLFLVGLAAATAAAKENRQSSQAGELRLKSIQFYSSGLANFNYVAELKSETALSFCVPSSSVSDVLRTISVHDPENGLETILARPYMSSEESGSAAGEERTIETESRISFLLSKKGEMMELTLDSGQEIAGCLIAVESSLEALGDQIAERVRVNVLSEKGAESVLLDEVVSFRCLNSKAQKRFERTVRELRNPKPTMQTESKGELAIIEVHLTEGKRRSVSISMMRSMPVWKCSYVLNDDSLRMHIVIDNPTNQDWEDVEISVADGRPIAFEIDLHQSVRLARRQLQLPVGIPGLPPIFEERMALENLARPGIGGDAFAGTGMGGAMGGMGGATGGYAGEDSFVKPDRPIRSYPSNLSLVTSAPQNTMADLYAIDLAFKQQAAREGSFKGAPVTFQFHCTTIPAHSSGLLASPILECKVTHCSAFVPGYDDQSTLMAIELVNESDSVLPAGPLTLLASGRYQGEAMLQRTSSDSTRLVSFALDTSVQVKELSENSEENVQQIEFDDGRKRIAVQRTTKQTRTFEIQNATARDRSVSIYLAKRKDWDLHPSRGSEVEQESIRVLAVAKAFAELKKEVVFFRQHSTSLEYAACELEQLKELLRSDVGEKEKAMVKELLDRRKKILTLKLNLDRVGKKLVESTATVQRLVEILSTTGLQQETVTKYAQRIEVHETALEELMRQKRDLQQELDENLRQITPEPVGPFHESRVLSDPFGVFGNDPFGDGN